MIHTRALLHTDGPALWPEHKPLKEVLHLKGETPEVIWESTYQGNPVPPSGTVFKREWWRGQNRFDIADRQYINMVSARWISFDTGLKDKEDNAYTACTVGELLPDYRMLVREVWRERLQFPDLPEAILTSARRWNFDEKLRGILIEDKASGISAYQTLSATAEDWIKRLLIAFEPHGDKSIRAAQAAVWCSNGSVMLPYPSADAPWLVDFEDELFSFPGSSYKDQVDSFGQLIIYTENLLAAGYEARNR